MTSETKETTTAPAAPGTETTEPTQRDLEYHGKAHGASGRDKVQHSFLGGLHTGSGGSGGAAGDLPVLGDVIVAQGSPAAWQRYGIVVPGGAALRNALVTDQGDTVPSHKPTLDATNPVIITPGGAGAPGTSLLYSHRDHNHPATDVASAAVLAATLALEYAVALAAGQQLTPSSAAMQNITGIALPLGANQTWRFAMTLISLSTVAADFKFQFTVPAGASLFFEAGPLVFGGTTMHYNSINAGVPVVLDGLTINVATEVHGTVICGATPGNMQLQAAQNTATAENIDFVVGGTNLFGRRMA